LREADHLGRVEQKRQHHVVEAAVVVRVSVAIIREMVSQPRVEVWGEVRPASCSPRWVLS
jgi:hypothetical protein